MKRIYFYDDDPTNIKQFRTTHKGVIAKLVADKPNSLMKGYDSYYYAHMFSKMYPNNRFAKLILEEAPKNPEKTRHYRITNEKIRSDFIVKAGLTVKEMHKIALTKARTVIFDWDHTLSVLQGLRLWGGTARSWTNNLNSEFYSLLEVAQFCAGTMERFHAMREMFASLRAQGTSIIILSNNGWATTQAKEEFVKILQIYDPELKKEDVVYGDQNKARVFRQASRFKSTRRVLKNR
jgi:hypothetical protein